MGNTTTQPSYQTFSLDTFEKNYHYEKEVHDPRFGLIKIFKNRTQPDTFLMVLTKSSLDGDFEKFKQELEVRSRLTHENLTKIIGYIQDHNQKLCGVTSAITVYAEFEKNNLEKELNKKAVNKVNF